MSSSSHHAIRATVTGTVQGVGFRDAIRRRAHELGLLGWVRNTEDGALALHAEGPAPAIDALLDCLRHGPRGASVENVTFEAARIEGHEQFAIRGVPAGVFVIQQHAANTRHFDLRLQVDGALRSWALPRGPSLDPAIKRLAVQVEDHDLVDADFEGATVPGRGVIVWDRGLYEQGGRVPWPAALDRGHAVFVLHGAKLRGGFALQRTRQGVRPQWLLIKRRDEHARPGYDVVVSEPASVVSGRGLEELLNESSRAGD